MSAKAEWNAWLDEIDNLANDLDNLANDLAREVSPWTTDDRIARPITEGGRKARHEVTKAIAEKRHEEEARLRAQAVILRAMPGHAKWLGAPGRERTLEVVAMDTDEQRAALAKLPKATQRSLGWNGRRLTRSYAYAHADRIVAGARLYVATRKP